MTITVIRQLRQVAEILENNTRDGIDSAFRVGGEEMVCVVGCGTEKATDIAERIRWQIEAAVFEYNNKGICSYSRIYGCKSR